MQRRESTTPGAMMAPVGQAVMHLLQLPQMLKDFWEGEDHRPSGVCDQRESVPGNAFSDRICGDEYDDMVADSVLGNV